MGMNETPSSNRVHISFFGKRNSGKSSLVNAVTGQSLSIVSNQKGTTTDPVYKSMELLPLGPVVIIDTPGFDDEGALGLLRVEKTKQVLRKTDIAVLVVDATVGLDTSDQAFITSFQEQNIPYLVAYNKSDLLNDLPSADKDAIYVSAQSKMNIQIFKERLASLVNTDQDTRHLVGDLLHPGDLVVLVVPIDQSAPKGRLILPQQQTIRDILDANATVVVTKETGLTETFKQLKQKPALVITDSQVFSKVSADTPLDIPLTSFSILMARYKGFLSTAVKGASQIKHLQDNDLILIAEGCTHHRQCGDIGTVKLPALLQKYTGKKLNFSFTSGQEYPEDLTPYRLVIHCGGCMLNEREIHYRMVHTLKQQIPFTNYGTAIAQMTGILKRSLQIFPDITQQSDL